MEIVLSLGSNLGDRLTNLSDTRAGIEKISGVRLISSAPIYETEPVDVLPLHKNILFLNTVIIIDYKQQISELSLSLHNIESEHGRTRSSDRNLPRRIDIDIICADDLKINQAGLIVPHPRWHERRFVVQPFADVRPNLVVPGQAKSVKELLLTLPGRPKVLLLTDKW